MPKFSVDSEGWSPFLVAADTQPGAVTLLLEHVLKIKHINDKSIAEIKSDITVQKKNEVKALFKQANTQKKTALMLAPRHIEAFKVMLKTIQVLDRIDQKEILAQVDANGCNALMKAAHVNIEACELLLAVIKTLKIADRRAILAQTSTLQSNVLMIAAFTQTTLVKPIIKAINTLLDKKDRKAILMQSTKVDEWNALMLALSRREDEAIEKIIEAIKFLNYSVQKAILEQTNREKNNAFIVAIIHYPQALKWFVTILKTYDIAFQKKILKTINKNGYDSLDIAVELGNPESIETLLNYIMAFKATDRDELFNNGLRKSASHNKNIYFMLKEQFEKKHPKIVKLTALLVYPELLSSPQFILSLVKIDGLCIAYADQSLLSDVVIGLAAIKNNLEVYEKVTGVARDELQWLVTIPSKEERIKACDDYVKSENYKQANVIFNLKQFIYKEGQPNLDTPSFFSFFKVIPDKKKSIHVAKMVIEILHNRANYTFSQEEIDILKSEELAKTYRNSYNLVQLLPDALHPHQEKPMLE